MRGKKPRAGSQTPINPKRPRLALKRQKGASRGKLQCSRRAAGSLQGPPRSRGQLRRNAGNGELLGPMGQSGPGPQNYGVRGGEKTAGAEPVPAAPPGPEGSPGLCSELRSHGLRDVICVNASTGAVAVGDPAAIPPLVRRFGGTSSGGSHTPQAAEMRKVPPATRSVPQPWHRGPSGTRPSLRGGFIRDVASRSHGLVELSPNFLMEKPRGTRAALCTAGLGQAVTCQSPLGTNQHLISPTRSPHTQESHGSLPSEAQWDASRGERRFTSTPRPRGRTQSTRLRPYFQASCSGNSFRSASSYPSAAIGQ